MSDDEVSEILLYYEDKRQIIYIRLDQGPLLIDSGARQLIGVSVVPDKCSEAKERSIEAENGSRLSPPVGAK